MTEDSASSPSTETNIMLDPYRQEADKTWHVPLLRVRGVRIEALISSSGNVIPEESWRSANGIVHWSGTAEMPLGAKAKLALDTGHRFKLQTTALAVAVVGLVSSVVTAYISKDCDSCLSQYASVAVDSGCERSAGPGTTVENCVKTLRAQRQDLERKVTDLRNAKESAEALAEDLQRGTGK